MKSTWLKNNYKWLVPILAALTVIVYLLATSNLGKRSTDFAQAYADKELYQKAIFKANKNTRVLELLGEIQPIGSMTILNGEVKYSENDQRVTSTIKVRGTKDKAKLDLKAYKNQDEWVYILLKLRIDKPGGNIQNIEVINPENKRS